ncbi:ABC transporter substrate-binding protein [Salipaludibacillus aurantiacus]|uniref:Raffinose/stachyose/melibiose transport system substrate-binding protein n=1 Tax=Salipaludibacillus aurantiacus TaxID=1601833 RepID=A0A1H9UFJ0_9BACI|nr:extracellular solute-binding protein [Salipaludibacillus aurantiacus]SES07803.1 raffinose/stachyose/melibiose transport system substrate-binding protein [Salipaludibacillus aurantiacus]
MSIKKVFLLPAAFGLTAFAAGCGGTDGGDGQVTLELFSNKSESIGTYERLIEDFESENPDISINLEAPPEAETVLRTRLTRGDMPDLMSIGGNATYGELAREGVFKDFTESAVLDEVQSSYVDMLNALVGPESEGNYGVPYATNANHVIYNQEKVDELGIDIPQDWNEFIDVLETAQDAGETPIFFTLQEAWTGMAVWNAVAGNLVEDDFAERKNEGEATFVDEYDEVADKMVQLLDYGHSDNFGVGYNDGNRAFATGGSVFYIQGNWAIPEILESNPDIELGTFALPSNEDAEENELVSGVDVVLTVSEETDHPEEAEKFLEFMVSQDVAEQYIDEQSAFSAVEGVFQEDEVFDGIREYFENDRLTSFPDHYYPAGMGVENLVQDFLINQNKEQSLEEIDNEWDANQNR